MQMCYRQRPMLPEIVKNIRVPFYTMGSVKLGPLFASFHHKEITGKTI